MLKKALSLLCFCVLLFSKSGAEEICGLVIAQNIYNFINFQIGSNRFTSTDDGDKRVKFKGFSVGPTYIPLFKCPEYGSIDEEDILNNFYVGLKYRDNIEKNAQLASRYRGIDAYLYFTPFVGLNLGYGHLRTQGGGVKSSGDYLQAGVGIFPAMPFVNFELLFRQNRHKDAHPLLKSRSNSVVLNFNLIFLAAFLF